MKKGLGLINISLITAVALSGCSKPSEEGNPLQEAAIQTAIQDAEAMGACETGTVYDVQYHNHAEGDSQTEYNESKGLLRITMLDYNNSMLQFDASLHEVLHYCHDLYYSEDYPIPIITTKGEVRKALGFMQIYGDGNYDAILEEAYAYYMTAEYRDTWDLAESYYYPEYIRIARFMQAIVWDTNNIDPSQMTLSQFIHAVFLKSAHENPHLLSELTDMTHQIKAGTMTIEDAMYRIYLLRE